MKESLWGYYLVLLGIMVSTVMIMMSNMTTTNQQDYYLLKEVTNAAMIDSIDYGYYRKYGEMKINTEKFLENFLRRFAQNISKNNTYKIDFYSVYENPPSVSIKVTTNTGDYHIDGDSTNVDIVNSIDAILEADNSVHFDQVYYSIPYSSCDSENETIDTNGYCKIYNQAMFNQMDYYKTIVDKFKSNIGESEFKECKIRVLSSEYLRVLKDATDIKSYNDQFSSTYNYVKNVSDTPKLINEENYLTTNIKDVKFTISDDKSHNKILSWTAKFNCNNIGYGNEGTIKKYRKSTKELNKSIIAAQQRGDTSEEDRLLKSYNNDYSKAAAYISEDVYNKLSSTEKENYELTPYYNNCLVGIAYRIDFFYDKNYDC